MFTNQVPISLHVESADYGVVTTPAERVRERKREHLLSNRERKKGQETGKE